MLPSSSLQTLIDMYLARKDATGAQRNSERLRETLRKEGEQAFLDEGMCFAMSVER